MRCRLGFTFAVLAMAIGMPLVGVRADDKGAKADAPLNCQGVDMLSETAARDPRFGRAALAAARGRPDEVSLGHWRELGRNESAARNVALEMHAHLRALGITERVEAVIAVPADLDAAALTGRDELRVIHGRGTGAIRTAVRDELSRHPLVSAHEPDAADGATVVRLG